MAIRGFLQCLLKLVNFLLIVVGLLTVVYAAWMLTVWYKHGPITLAQTVEMLQGLDFELPPSWFIWAAFVVGGVVLLVGLNGACAAEAARPCCLGFYQFGLLFILVTEGLSAVTIYFLKLWDKDLLPDDPSGQSKRVKEFVAENAQFCKWGFLAVVLVQILALFLASLISFLGPRPSHPPTLPTHATPHPTQVNKAKAKKAAKKSSKSPAPKRAPAPKTSKKTGVNSPLLSGSSPGEASSSSSQPAPLSSTEANPEVPIGPIEPQGAKNDAWQTRMHEKYGVDTANFANIPDRLERRQPPDEEEGGKKSKKCSIM